MTKEDISAMAREAGASSWQKKNCEVDYLFGVEELRCFAALVAAAAKAEEREQGQKWFDAVTAQHKQEILAERDSLREQVKTLNAQREPLTPEWIWTWLMDWCKRNGSSPANYNSLFKMVADARAIEAKLKEKNT